MQESKVERFSQRRERFDLMLERAGNRQRRSNPVMKRTPVSTTVLRSTLAELYLDSGRASNEAENGPSGAGGPATSITPSAEVLKPVVLMPVPLDREE
jgi:hypothetical protein